MDVYVDMNHNKIIMEMSRAGLAIREDLTREELLNHIAYCIRALEQLAVYRAQL